MEKSEWKVSLHGGHSGEFCDHAEATLREMLEAAVSAGYDTFGVSEHVPRHESRFLYPEEVAMGWDIPKIHADFARYAAHLQELVPEFEGRISVLRGLEMEIVPIAKYVSLMQDFRNQKLADGSPAFDYAVGSVHYVDEVQIDAAPASYLLAVEACGGIEALAVRYYELVAEMALALHPEVVGHLDLIKRNLTLAGFGDFSLETPKIQAAAESAMEAVRSVGAILDLNTAGWRKGLGEPYPAPPLVQRAHAMGIGFCFGDDSHRPSDVGAGVPEAREYLLRCGVPTVTVLNREGVVMDARTVQRVVAL